MKRHKAFAGLLALLLCCAFVFVAPAGAAEAGEEAATAVKIAPCKGLGPYKDVDELLYQFYINLDSDCLFKMPLADLEKIWGIEILSDEKIQDKSQWGAYPKLRESATFERKPYKAERDAFYVEAMQKNGTTTAFNIHITRFYINQYCTLFPDGDFPKLLPKALEKVWYVVLHPVPPSSGNSSYHGPRCMRTPDIKQTYYYWLNKDKTRMIYLDGLEAQFTRIAILNTVRERFLQPDNVQP